MAYEEDLVALLAPLVNEQAFWLKAPNGYTYPDTGVLIASQAGGQESWYVDQTRPGYSYARVQIAAWSPDPLVSINLLRSARNAIAASTFIAEPKGNGIDMDQEDIGMFGRVQHFGIWYPDP